MGDEEDLFSRGLIADNINLIALEKIEKSINVVVKIRYKDIGAKAVLHPSNDNRIKIIFDEPKKSVTPGQSAVFYQEDIVIGGGVIRERIN